MPSNPRLKLPLFIPALVLSLSACGGGTSPDADAKLPNAQAPSIGIPSGEGHGWKISWGTGQKSTIDYDPATGKPASGTYWPVAAVFQELLAEESPTPLVIDEGPNKGKSTNLQWKGTNIPYDYLYHPLTAAVCKTADGKWAGFGSAGKDAVYEDENGEGHIFADHLAARVGSNVVSTHTVPSITAPASCGASPVWYTSYYDRAGNGPGTQVY